MPLPRRAFLASAARSAAGLAAAPFLPACGPSRAASPALPPSPWAPPSLPADLPRDVRITRITLTAVAYRRPKFIGKNAYKGDHGDFVTDNLLRLFTDSGLAALGTGDKVTPEMARPLLGKSLADLCNPATGFPEEFRRMDLALWDLMGQVTGQPVWRLLGGAGPREVAVYDGTLYLSDLIHPEKGAAQVAEELDASLTRGFRAFKLKIGRGFKWMPPWDAGFARDLEVIRACRRAAGPDCRLTADANNGYGVLRADGTVDYDASLARVTALLDSVADQNLYFLEELFPENPDAYRRLLAEFRRRVPGTLYADGENMGEWEQIEPYLPDRLIEIVQPNIKLWGLSRWRRLAALASDRAILCVPHNWGSRIGLYACLQLGRGIPNFGMAEEDVADDALYDKEGWTFAAGRYTVPDDRPGLGFGINAKAYEEMYAGKEAWEVAL